MSKKKKIVIIAVAVLVVIGIVTGVLVLRDRNNKAFVQQVAEMNNSWILLNESSSGTITSASEQKIVLRGTDTVTQVFVTQGQQVAKGDALFQYDPTSLNLSVQEKAIAVDACAASLDIAKQQLAAYQKIVPVNDPTPADEPAPYQPAEEEKFPSAPAGGSGSMDDPFIYNCNTRTLLTGAQINEWINAKQVVQMRVLDSAGNVLSVWTVDGSNFLPVANDVFWRVADRSPWTPPQPDPGTPAAKTYTQAEKDKLVSNQQLTIRRMENELALAQNSLAQTRAQLADNTVRAEMDGVVKVIGDPSSPPKDGSAFCTITSAAGVTLSGYISELDLADSRIGDKLTVTSWMTGSTAEAEITYIADYPTDATGFYGGEGNPNVSYYQFSARMDNAGSFEAGESVNVQPYVEGIEQMIVLEKIYVRSDDEGPYVLIDNGSGRLARQNVTIQSTYESNYVKILSGLTLEDYVAFPYGDSARVGARTTTEMKFSLF